MKLRKEKPMFNKSWKDINMRMGIELAQLDIEDPVELLKMQMAIINDTDTSEIDRLPMAAMIEFTKEYAFISTIPEKKMTKTIKVDGKRYGLIDFDKMSMAQFVDIEEYYNAGLLNNLHKILSVIYLPIEKYNIFTKKYKLVEYEPSKEREDMFLDLDMEFIWSITLFFYHIVETYIKLIKSYSQEQNTKMKMIYRMREEGLSVTQGTKD
jgi:hypothetical protein